ncbi:glycosyltransferase [Bacillus sp. AGMB 02131]|uniref:Glycosyltransferase n=1 Tax=Peribacillus faecalis TaxID=2772559 RepID=A0A927H9L1_9BACI|nr:glycosyltransferase [Peribacillus faecalis]MBD3107004.1 glycosyltransferase [Peribacillus faecalis]
MTKKSHTLMLLLLLPLTFLFSVSHASATPQRHTSNVICTPLTTTLKMEKRKLWSEHVFWTRNLIISDVDNLPDKQAVLQRLLKNQDDLGKSIEPYYGKEAGNQLAKLLRDHILIAVKVVDAAKNGDTKALDASNKEWYQNANDIAIFLSKANPNWSHSELKQMLDTHLGFVTEEAVARIKKDWPANIATNDKGVNHMLQFADIISNGIIKQFPNKFK